MEKLLINSTETTPLVSFDPDNGLLEIEGRLIPEDVGDFFAPIFVWLENYLPENNKPILVRFCLFYYNTSSSKRIFNIMRKFDALYLKGIDLKIRWEYEEGDEDTVQEGEDYKTFLKVPFEIVKV
ncbi:MAG: DUF1987 domain-containing protein [Bacteroidetes bacterium]|nr:DUF1987 domain-containing protein [Bacteroidota bacterium]